ncbi:MAG: hypothetical protein DI534_02290 [Leifsonia xyli]|nr:MAG: hypothetical protein DI534_02290 [Leifsonia xyli]
MNCLYCGTQLPPGALFCVECGRSVGESGPAAQPSPLAQPDAGAVVGMPPAPPAPVPHCPQCGSAIEDADIFCGECGFVLRPMTAGLELAPAGELASERYAEWAPEYVPAPAPAAAPTPAPAPAEVDAPEPTASAELEDIESTRIVAPEPAAEPAAERYVLQFSTGESVVVAGTGLIGRNPAPEPGEFVDELVPIFDVGKSVSKSHIEFGQEAGRFWVSDRYSTNGTIVRQPDTAAVRCNPGKRYVIARGSRVEIGEQFFIVS